MHSPTPWRRLYEAVRIYRIFRRINHPSTWRQCWAAAEYWDA